MTRIEEIRKRVDAATKGPWTIEGDLNIMAGDGYSFNSFQCNEFLTHERNKANIKFAAHSRADVPWLLAMLHEAVSDKIKLSYGSMKPDFEAKTIQAYYAVLASRIEQKEK